MAWTTPSRHKLGHYVLWYPWENTDMDPGLSLREDTGGCGGGTARGQGACDIHHIILTVISQKEDLSTRAFLIF